MRAIGRLWFMVILAALAVPSSWAADDADAGGQPVGFYIVPALGAFIIDDYCDDIAKGNTSCDDLSLGGGFSAGYHFNRHFAVESGLYYSKGGKAEREGTSNDFSFSTEYQSLSFGGRGYIPFAQYFFLTGKAGVHLWQVDYDGTPPVALADDGTDLYLGGGVGFAFSDNFRFLVDYTKLISSGDNFDSDANAINASAMFIF